MTAKTKRNLWIVLGVLVLGALMAWTYMQSQNKEKGLAVEFGEAERRTIEERVSASGRIFPVTEVAISSDVSGEVVELRIAEGDSVRQGALLARVDADAYESQVASGRATVNAAQARVSTAKASIDQNIANKKQLEAQLITMQQALKRAQSLAGDGLVSAADIEQTTAEVGALEAQLEAADANIRSARETVKATEFEAESAQARLNELRTNLRRTSITAPMTGVVSLLNVEEGERVVGTMQMAGTELLRIADLSRMEVQVEVSENDIPRVALDDVVEIEVDAYLDRKFAGRVTEISNSASGVAGAAQVLTSDQVTNFVVTISIDPASYADLVTASRPYPFRPGMSAAVEILTESVSDALAVPIAAVTAREPIKAKDDRNASDDDLVEVVWVVADGADTVTRREVRTGVQDRAFIQVLEGVTAGERVVVGPYSAVSRKLDSGDEVHEQKSDSKDDKDDDDDDDD